MGDLTAKQIRGGIYGQRMQPPPDWLTRTWYYAGATGVAIFLVGGMVAGFYLGTLFTSLNEALEVSAEAVAAGAATIEVVDDSLTIVGDLVGSARVIGDETEQALLNMASVTGSVVDLLEDDLPAEIDSVVVAMDGLIQTAGVVDGVLTTLSFVGVDYDPEVPLDEALIELEQSLLELKPVLADEASRLENAETATTELALAVGEFDFTLAQLELEVEQTGQVTFRYQELADEARAVIGDATVDLGSQRVLLTVLIVAASLIGAAMSSRLWWVGRADSTGQ